MSGYGVKSEPGQAPATVVLHHLLPVSDLICLETMPDAHCFPGQGLLQSPAPQTLGNTAGTLQGRPGHIFEGAKVLAQDFFPRFLPGSSPTTYFQINKSRLGGSFHVLQDHRWSGCPSLFYFSRRNRGGGPY